MTTYKFCIPWQPTSLLSHYNLQLLYPTYNPLSHDNLHDPYLMTTYQSSIPGFPNISVRRPKSAKPYSGWLNPPIHRSEWPTKARAVGPIKPTKSSVWMAYKSMSSFRRLAIPWQTTSPVSHHTNPISHDNYYTSALGICDEMVNKTSLLLKAYRMFNYFLCLYCFTLLLDSRFPFSMTSHNLPPLIPWQTIYPWFTEKKGQLLSCNFMLSFRPLSCLTLSQVLKFPLTLKPQLRCLQDLNIHPMISSQNFKNQYKETLFSLQNTRRNKEMPSSSINTLHMIRRNQLDHILLMGKAEKDNLECQW